MQVRKRPLKTLHSVLPGVCAGPHGDPSFHFLRGHRATFLSGCTISHQQGTRFPTSHALAFRPSPAVTPRGARWRLMWLCSPSAMGHAATVTAAVSPAGWSWRRVYSGRWRAWRSLPWRTSPAPACLAASAQAPAVARLALLGRPHSWSFVLGVPTLWNLAFQVWGSGRAGHRPAEDSPHLL